MRRLIQSITTVANYCYQTVTLPRDAHIVTIIEQIYVYRGVDYRRGQHQVEQLQIAVYLTQFCLVKK